MQGNDMAALLPKCFMLYGNWLAETRSQSPNVILDKYLSKVWHITLLLAVKLSCVSCLWVVCSVTHRAFWIKLLVIVVLDLTDRHGLVHCEHCIVAPLPPIDSIWAMTIGSGGQEDCSVLCYVRQLCTVVCTQAHKCEQFLNLCVVRFFVFVIL